MSRMIRQIIIAISLLFTTNNILAQDQEADLIFKDGDTISGFAMITKSDRIKFRVSQEDKPSKWDFKTVKGIILYGLDDQIELEYITYNKKQKPVLMEILYFGKVNLYRRSGSSFFIPSFNEVGGSLKKGGSTLYVKREHEEIATNLAGRFKKKSLEYFKDCPEIVEIFQTKRYLKYSIEDVVVEYNTFCDN